MTEGAGDSQAAALAGPDRFYCETYHCNMAVAACIKRQKNARKYMECRGGWGAGTEKPGALDLVCRDCEQGRRIMEEQAGVRCQVSGDKSEGETRICADPDCEFAGEPQPIGRFQLHGRAKIPGTRLPICRACMARRRVAGVNKKKKIQESAPPVPADVIMWNGVDMSIFRQELPTWETPVDPSPVLPDVTPTEQPLAPEYPRADWSLDSDNYLILDFSGHENLLKKIRDIAVDQLRSPANQALYWLRIVASTKGETP
jgi:hypothetical protein